MKGYRADNAVGTMDHVGASPTLTSLDRSWSEGSEVDTGHRTRILHSNTSHFSCKELEMLRLVVLLSVVSLLTARPDPQADTDYEANYDSYDLYGDYYDYEDYETGSQVRV